MKKLVIIVLAALNLVLSACQKDSPANLLVNSPACSIKSIEQIDGGFAKVAMYNVHIVNDGNGPTAFKIGCYVKLKKGNLIIDEGGVGFGTLLKGEEKKEDVWFSKIESHNEYNQAEITLYWYDAEDKYYEGKTIRTPH